MGETSIYPMSSSRSRTRSLSPGRFFRWRLASVPAITERTSAERQLRESEERLRAEKMEAVGRLAGGVAHDFNNLLLAIRGYCELAAADADDPAEVSRNILQIRLASEMAASLTSQLLAFSGKQVLQSRPVDLSALVSERKDLLERLVGETIVLETELVADVKTVRLDVVQMEQALVDVVLNARDAGGDGGRIRIEAENAFVTGGRGDPSISPGAYVRLSISDTGCGMDDATRARAFEPFFTTKGALGTGLSLSTVLGFVQQSGGHIFLHSVPYEGTTVDFYFPAVDDPVAVTEPRLDPDGGIGGSETVLLVEDEEAVREVLRKALEREGYSVLVAWDGEDALAVAEAHAGELHAVITDVVMPRLGGVELAQRLRAKRPDARVLYMSGHLQDPDIRRQVEAHGVFLQKPFAPSELALRLRELLEG
jgi:two-component system cell cycle sensor histidine kinase/response regulator CckA